MHALIREHTHVVFCCCCKDNVFPATPVRSLTPAHMLRVFMFSSPHPKKARHELMTFFSNKRLDVQNWIKKGWLGTVSVQMRGSTGLDSSVVGVPIAWLGNVTKCRVFSVIFPACCGISHIVFASDLVCRSDSGTELYFQIFILFYLYICINLNGGDRVWFRGR